MQYLKIICAAIILGIVPAAAQQHTVEGANPEFLQHALGAMQAQRNQAMDSAAVMRAQLDMANAQIEKMKAQLQKPAKKPAKEAPSP